MREIKKRGNEESTKGTVRGKKGAWGSWEKERKNPNADGTTQIDRKIEKIVERKKNTGGWPLSFCKRGPEIRKKSSTDISHDQGVEENRERMGAREG